MNNLTGAARRVTRNFDQFSVICVFGSVVGCVVLPLMIQSMESFIITFLVLFLTAKPLKGRLFPSGNPQDHERRRSRERDENKKAKKSAPKKKPVQVIVSSEQVHKMREEDLLRQEQQRLEDRERRLEEKREKKARKKEERLQRKEEEKREKEREEQARRERQEARLMKKKEEKEKKQKTSSFGIPTRENIQSIVNSFKPLKRERKHSASSSASSISAHSTSCHPPRFHHHGNGKGSSRRHAAPFRASSDPELSVTARTSLAPTGKHWQSAAPHTLPSTHGSSHWYTDVATRMFPSLPVVTSSAAVSQPLLLPQGNYFYPMTTPLHHQATPTQSSTCWSVPPTGCAGNDHPSQVGESLQHLVPQAAWLPVNINSGPRDQEGNGVRNFSPAPGTGATQQLNGLMVGGANGPSTLTSMNNYDGSFFNSGFGNTGVLGHHGNSSCYSLFSNGSGCGPAPFSPVGGLLNLDTSMDHMRYQPVSTGSPLSVNSDGSDGVNWLTNEHCGNSLQINQPDVSAGRQNGGLVESIGSTVAVQGDSARLNEGEKQFDEWPNI